MNRRNVLKAIAASGTGTAVGGNVAGKNNPEDKYTQPWPLTGSEGRKTLRKALSDPDFEMLTNEFQENGWRVRSSDAILLHVPFTDPPEDPSLDFTGISDMRLVVLPAEPREGADQGALVWTSEQWNNNLTTSVAYKAEINLPRNNKSVEYPDHEFGALDANSLKIYKVNDGKIDTGVRNVDPQEFNSPSSPSSANSGEAESSCDCKMHTQNNIPLSCLVALSVGFSSMFTSCGACTMLNPVACWGCFASVSASGASLPSCAEGSSGVECRDFDDLPGRQYAHRCHMCINLEQEDCEEDFDGPHCRCRGMG